MRKEHSTSANDLCYNNCIAISRIIATSTVLTCRSMGSPKLANQENGEISVRIIKSLDELKMPKAHEIYLELLLEYFRTYPMIERVLLFGSCASGKASHKSDLDLFLIGSDLNDEDEWDIAWNCPRFNEPGRISCDILSSTNESYKEMSKIPGMVQYAIELRGVDLSGLLHTR